MNDLWTRYSLPWWFGANDGLPASPEQPLDGPSSDPWRTIAGQTSSNEAPPQGGVLGSLGTGGSGGILGQLARPLEHLESAKYWGAAFPRTNSQLVPASNLYLSPVPQAPSWNSIALRSIGRATYLFSEPSSAPSSDGGNSDMTESTAGEISDDPRILSDVTPDNEWIPGAAYAGVGHHYVPRAIFAKYKFPEETRKVFDAATTGQLPFHGWHRYDELHRVYSSAIDDLLKGFMAEHGIAEQQMTPDHARAVLRAVAESDEPRIRAYRAMLQHMGRLYRLRMGVRGSE